MTIQKMTETNKSNDKMDMLISILKARPDAVDVMLDSLLNKGNKKKKQSWRGRELILFPNNEYKYVTPEQHEAKEIVDGLVNSTNKKEKLSTVPSEAGMNKFYASNKIRGLSKDMQFWAKHYYKQFVLEWKKE